MGHCSVAPPHHQPAQVPPGGRPGPQSADSPVKVGAEAVSGKSAARGPGRAGRAGNLKADDARGGSRVPMGPGWARPAGGNSPRAGRAPGQGPIGALARTPGPSARRNAAPGGIRTRTPAKGATKGGRKRPPRPPAGQIGQAGGQGDRSEAPAQAGPGGNKGRCGAGRAATEAKSGLMGRNRRPLACQSHKEASKVGYLRGAVS